MASQLQRFRQSRPSTQQTAYLEYSCLKSTCPEGMYLTLTPGNPLRWAGVLFVREGPYAPAVLRFHVSFPPGYPTLPPVITFFSDIFHPLVTPLTTYIYTTGSPSTDTVSATDEERLPPGGLNLRHGFPGWFGRGKKSIASSRVSSGNVSESLEAPIRNDASERKESGANAPFTASLSQEPQQPTGQTIKDSIQQPYGIFQVLNYVKRAFDSETLLDGLPSEAAGNPGAWKAWRAHRAQKTESSSSWLAAEKEVGGLRKEDKAMSPASQQDEWNWDGVWESRVRKGIDSSISDAVLFGRAGVVDDLINFSDIDDELVQVVKTQVIGGISN